MEVFPLLKSKKYTGPFQTEGKMRISAIAFDPATGKSSPVSHEKFDISRKDWKIIGIEDEKAMPFWMATHLRHGTSQREKNCRLIW